MWGAKDAENRIWQTGGVGRATKYEGKSARVALVLMKIEGKLLPRFLLHAGGGEYMKNDNHPDADQQFPSGVRTKITRGGPFI